MAKWPDVPQQNDYQASSKGYARNVPPRFQKQQQDQSQPMMPPPTPSSTAVSTTRQQPPSPASGHPPMPHGFRPGPGQMPPPPWGPQAWPGMPPPYFMDPRYGPRPPLDMQGKLDFEMHSHLYVSI